MAEWWVLFIFGVLILAVAWLAARLYAPKEETVKILKIKAQRSHRTAMEVLADPPKLFPEDDGDDAA